VRRVRLSLKAIAEVVLPVAEAARNNWCKREEVIRLRSRWGKREHLRLIPQAQASQGFLSAWRRNPNGARMEA